MWNSLRFSFLSLVITRLLSLQFREFIYHMGISPPAFKKKKSQCFSCICYIVQVPLTQNNPYMEVVVDFCSSSLSKVFFISVTMFVLFVVYLPLAFLFVFLFSGSPSFRCISKWAFYLHPCQKGTFV